MDKSTFRHKITVTVRFNEIDMLGVCNNAVYINYFEMGRLEYIKSLGLIPRGGIFSDGSLFFIVRNEINYLGFARYDDELNIYSKIKYIKNSSFGFEHIVEISKTGEIIAEGSGVIARVDPRTKKSTPLPEELIRKVTGFEQEVDLRK